MSVKDDLLIEIGTEELPPKSLRQLSAAFSQGISDGLKKLGLSYEQLHSYATPRRLAVLVSQLDAAQQDKIVERRGPAVTAAFGDDGCPTPAAAGFAKSCGVQVEDLQTSKTDKGAWLVYHSEEKGQPTTDLIADVVNASLDKLPIPKRMRWGDSQSQFVRPVHWVVLLFGDQVIEAQIMGLTSGRVTRGHRFHHPETLYLGEPNAYSPLLETQGLVVADFDTRKEAVRAQVLEAAAQLGGTAVIDNDLLDEVTAMVEWPMAISGNFDTRFLQVPTEALITTMKSNQKYFHVVDATGALLPYFITVSNIASLKPEVVRAGNERVIRPRLADAEFFWNQDRKHSLESRQERLQTILFQKKLGTLYDKSQRVAALAAAVAAAMGADAEQAKRAAWLSKCDLMTEMVYEFPELQGIMGRYYCAHDGEAADVCSAMEEQYMPRFAGDSLPKTQAGQALAIADKLDTIVGIFGIGQAPTGNKDPFALRRAALGLLRTIIECELNLDIDQLLDQAIELLGSRLEDKDTKTKVYDFMMDRLRAYYQERKVPVELFEAVLARRPVQPLDFDRRVLAVTEFRQMEAAESLAQANKRSSNILRQAREKGIVLSTEVDPSLLEDDAEKALYSAIANLTGEVAPLFAAHDYSTALTRLASLQAPVDQFFLDVMVMVEAESLRNNRLALMAQMRDLFLQVADLSRL
ncbi:MAG: glycine--tRNA ligase subunit beta [Gammaproteobacteria bacterium]|nr:glycine--tRNA ligase subunit beta [Gammaproteobacteria bacterium]MDH5799587.1 glycine--tRNA ligase subunit beta [Gammaproteobacteria bacterium]